MQIPEDFFRWLVIFFVRPQQQSKPLFVSRLFDKEKIGKAVARIALAVAFSILPVSLSSADQPREQDFNIPQQSVKSALNSLATQANVFLLFPYDQVIEVNANPVVGVYSIQQALDLLLKNTGLNGDLTQGGVLAISRAGTNASATANNGKGKSMNTSKRKNVLATMVGLFATAGGVGSALGQGDEAATTQGRIDEIIVTATKRGGGTNIQDTAMSISAVTSEDISQKNLVSMADYLDTLPGVNQLDRGPGRNAIVIRGITSDPSFGDATVGIYFGDVPLAGLSFGPSSSPDIKLVDLERVEVLRGPQGTLYGAGSLTGAVRNIPKETKLETLEGHLKVGYSSTHGGDAGNNMVGILNVPLVEDKLAVRASLYSFENGGYIDNVAETLPAFVSAAADYNASELAVGRKDVGGSDYTGGRVSVRWKATDKLNINLSHITQELESDGLPDIALNLGTYEQSRLKLRNGESGKIFDEGLLDEIDITNLVIEYDLGWGELVSSSSWSDSHTQRRHDLTWLRLLFDAVPFPYSNFNDYNNEVFTEELRVSSSLDGPMQFVIGGFYSDTDRLLETRSYYGGDPALPTNPVGVGNTLRFLTDDIRNIEQRSYFGELSYEIMPNQLEATLGLRDFSYDRKQDRTTAFFGNPVSAILESTESDTTFKANVTYRPSDQAMVYATWNEGFRLGKPQAPLDPTTCDIDNDGILDGTSVPIDTGDINSDTLESYEVGGKFTSIDGRLTFSGSIYRMNWEGLPVTVNGDCGLTLIVNAGEAKSEGVELETKLSFTPDLHLDIGFSYVSTKLKTDVPTAGGFIGDRLPGAPRFNISVAIQYDFEVFGNLSYLRSDLSQLGDFYETFGETGQVAGDYSLLNVAAGMKIDQLDVNFSIKNLTNIDDYSLVALTSNPTAGFNTRVRPRTVNLDFTYNF